MPCCRRVLTHTHYHNSNLIWRTVSRRVDEVIPSGHPRRVASRVIKRYGLIYDIYAFFLTFFQILKPVLVFNPENLLERLP